MVSVADGKLTSHKNSLFCALDFHKILLNALESQNQIVRTSGKLNRYSPCANEIQKQFE